MLLETKPENQTPQLMIIQTNETNMFPKTNAHFDITEIITGYMAFFSSFFKYTMEPKKIN